MEGKGCGAPPTSTFAVLRRCSFSPFVSLFAKHFSVCYCERFLESTLQYNRAG